MDRRSAERGLAQPTLARRTRAGARRRPLRRASVVAALAALLVAAAAAIAAAPASAFSQRGHEFDEAFGTKVEKGEVEKGEALLGHLLNPAGVAVNETTGDVYVVDAGDQRVEQFHPEEGAPLGNPIAVWGFGVENGEEKFQVCKTTSCRAGKAGTGEGQFDYPTKLKGHQRAAAAIAVDNSPGSPSKGDVYVVTQTAPEQNVVEKFGPKGELLGKLALGEAKTVGGVAVDASGVVWVQASTETGEVGLISLEKVERFSNEATNKLLTTVQVRENEVTGLNAFCPTAGIGIEGAGKTLYLNHERLSLNPEVEACFPEQEEFNKEEKNKQKATETSVTAKLKVDEPPEAAEPTLSELDSEYTSGIAVDETASVPSGGDVYLDNQSSVAAFNDAGEFIQRFGEKQLSTGGGAGIAVDAATQDVYVVDFKRGRVDVFRPEAAGAPIINGVSYEDVEPTKSVLKALIDPHGEETEYFFEYGTQSCPSSACTSTTRKKIPAGFGDVEVEEPIEGLAPGTTYFFRVEAINKHGPAPGSGILHTFTTLPQALESLPDGRQWELVSPPEKQGASIEAIGGIGTGQCAPSCPAIQAAENGDAIAYGTNAPTEVAPEANRGPETQENISIRKPQGWTTKDIATPYLRGEGLPLGNSQEYPLFSSDLSLGVVKPWEQLGHLQEPPLQEVGGKPVTQEQQNIYLRNNFVESCEVARKGCFTPLVTPENDTVTPEFGGPEHLEILGASSNLKHVVFRSIPPLVEREKEKAKLKSIYEWNAESTTEQLKLVNVLPSGETSNNENGGIGAGENGEITTNARNAISGDGVHVVWSEGKHLYARDMATGNTLEVSQPEAGVEEIEGGAYQLPLYQGASADGKRIFFTDTAPLTKTSTLQPHATAEVSHGELGAENPTDLYVCELEENGAHEQKCKLTDLTAGLHGELGEYADLPSEMPGMSEDGTYVYFVANGALAPGAIRGSCETVHSSAVPPPGAACNLYVDHLNGKSEWERPKLVAILSNEDRPDWAGGPEPKRVWRLSSRVSPNGHFLAFMSKRPLTGKNNEDATSKAKGEVLDEEVFLYDAEHERVTCVSCNPTGAKPHGVLDTHNSGEGNGLLADRVEQWAGQTLAGNVPTWTQTSVRRGLYQSRYLTDQGRVFFNSPDQLVPMPAGETFAFKESVYEYEPAGLGSCTNPAGCVALLSGGTSNRESSFLDASTDGNNVFFITYSQLVAEDRDQSLDIYDARVCGSESCIQSAAAAPRPCEETASCRPDRAPVESFARSNSETVTSANVPKTISQTEQAGKPKPKAKPKPTRAQLLAKALASCRKHYKHNRKKRLSCERTARKHYAAKKAGHHGRKR